MDSLLVYVDCCDGTQVNCVRIKRDEVVSEVIQKVHDKRAMYSVDSFAVEAFSGSSPLQQIAKMEEVLKSGCGSEKNPLKLKFCKYNDCCALRNDLPE